MDGAVTRSAEELSREELYELVWQTPMSKLGPQLGTDGPSLAALCRKRYVPTPPLGYWQKRAVGRAPPTPPLPSTEMPAAAPAARPTAPARLRTKQPLPVSALSAEVEVAPETQPGVEDDNSLDPMHNLHPKVKAWVAEHRQEQEKRREESRRRKHDPWGWTPPPLSNLTERDTYRFRVTSTLFRAVEKEGGKIGEALLAGKVTFLVSEQELKCAIAEKMTRSAKPTEEAKKWTAYPDHHQTGLVSSGFLRVKFDTYVGGRSREWVEAPKKKMAAVLPEIVGAIIAAGPILAEAAREREEQRRRYQQEEAEHYACKRRQEIDDKRWDGFQERAGNWKEHERLLAFIAELRRRLETEGDPTNEDRPLSEWIAWAEERAEILDPFREGLRGLFEAVIRRD